MYTSQGRDNDKTTRNLYDDSMDVVRKCFDSILSNVLVILFRIPDI
jgi:hypothetical protein